MDSSCGAQMRASSTWIAALFLVVAGCARHDSLAVDYEFSATLTDGQPTAYVLVIDAASWRRLTDRRGESADAIATDVNDALRYLINKGLTTVRACEGVRWHYEAVSRTPKGDMKFTLGCGEGSTEARIAI
jgi:hypothetical protein